VHKLCPKRRPLRSGPRFGHNLGSDRLPYAEPGPTALIEDFPIDGYGEAFADIYDTWYSLADDTGPALDLVERLADGQPVLELGVGTGRLACELATRGLTVWGVDASSSMLDRLTAKSGGESVRTVLGDMEELDLPDAAPEFGVVFAAFNTLFCLPTDEAQRACLKRSADVLSDSGCVILELYVPGAPPMPHTRRYEIVVVTEQGAVLKVYEWWPDEELLVGEHMEVTASGVRSRPWRMHPLSVERIDALAGAASLELESRYASWDGQAFSPLSARHVSIYRKRAEPQSSTRSRSR
jgi:ubiquinone/menaquinone biosynthesis C-methylase UbiE